MPTLPTFGTAAAVTLAALLAATPLLSDAEAFAAAPEPTGETSPLPPLTPARPVVLPPVIERALPNGLRLVLLEDHLQPSLSMRLAIPAGAKHDPAGKTGLADAAADLLDQGTTTRTEDVIADTVDALGANLNASADSDYLFVSAGGLSTHAATLFELMADITLNPVFPAKEWERHRTRTLSSITAALARPSTVADAVLARRVYGAHPYGAYEAGTPETLAMITTEDMTAFHAAHFTPAESVLFLVGDITPDRAEELAAQHFGGWASKTAPVAPAAPQKTTQTTNRVTIIDRPGSEQTEIRIGALTAGYADPDRTVANVANAVLGGGGFEGRLIKEIRVKRGLSYGASSGFQREKDAGQFTISTFTKPASTGEATRIALDETRSLAETGPTETELSERKTYLTGSFAVGVATPQGVLGRVVPAVLYGTGAQEVSLFVPRVEAVTIEAARDALARAVPAAGLEIVWVGDAHAVREQASHFGDVTVIPLADLDLNATDLRKPAPPQTPPAPAAPPSVPPVTPAPPAPAEATLATAGVPAPFGASDAARAEGAKMLADAVAAHGGDAFLNLKSLKITGTGEITTPANAGGLLLPLDALTFYTAQPGKTRLEALTSLSPAPFIFVARGTGKGAFSSIGGQTRELSAAQVPATEPTELLRAAARNKYPAASVTLAVPEKTDGGTPLSAFEVRGDGGDITRVYLDPVHRIRKIVAQRARGGTILLGGYDKAVDGVLLPHSIHFQRDGADVLHLTFTTITVNPILDDVLFEKP